MICQAIVFFLDDNNESIVPVCALGYGLNSKINSKEWGARVGLGELPLTS